MNGKIVLPPVDTSRGYLKEIDTQEGDASETHEQGLLHALRDYLKGKKGLTPRGGSTKGSTDERLLEETIEEEEPAINAEADDNGLEDLL